MQTLAVAGKQPSEVGTHGRLRRFAAILFTLSHELFQSEVSMDFDPRWGDDPRDREDRGREPSQGSRGGLSDPRDRTSLDPRDVFMKDLNLPRGPERQRVSARGGDVTLRGSESRTLSIVGAFRVVPAGDLRDGQERPLDPRTSDLRHLKEAGLVQTTPAAGGDRALVVLTERGRDVLERHHRSTILRQVQGTTAALRDIVNDRWSREGRDKPDVREPRQEFYAGLRKPRELTHDSQIYRAYLKAAERLREEGATIRRVILDNELKREYQQFLQERNRGRSDSDGRPDRTPEEIHRWALEHNLPEEDGHVQIPDARIEYEDRDGRRRTEDLEVETLHYRGGHAAAKASSGFTRSSGSTMRVVSSRGSGGGCGGSRSKVRPGHCRQHREERRSEPRSAPR
jgi:hypothetical protein